MRNEAFFSTVAQIIPVIFLVLAIELRSFGFPETENLSRERTIFRIAGLTATIFGAAMLVFAEVIALQVLAGTTPADDANKDAVSTGLAYGGVLLSIQIGHRLTVPFAPQTPGARGISAAVWATLGVAALVYAWF